MLNSSRSGDEQAKVAVVRAMYEAYANKDRAALESLLADAFHFTSPLDNRIDRAMYFERCWPNSEDVEGFDFVAVVPAANRVFVIYEGRNKGGKRFRNTEVCLFQGQQVVEVEVYFGWSLPHKAPLGSFVDSAASESFADPAPARSLGELPG
jgi:ketosteroid isomerase-like protein